VPTLGGRLRTRIERSPIVARRLSMQVADIMHTSVKTADGEDTFADVAKMMRSNGISSVVVLNADRTLAGIVTERDIVNLVAAGGDPHSVQVAHGMTRRHLTTCEPKTDIVEAAEKMVSLNIRHLPVVEDGKVVGIVSIRDLTRWAADELSGGHEMPDIERSTAALRAASELQRQRRLS
jgi:CBS domain-containing protein